MLQYETWEKEVLEPFTKRFPERKEEFLTSSKVQVKTVYTSEDLSMFEEERDLSFPGSYPFTRGIYPTLYRGRLWTMRQYAGFGTAEETNQRYRELLKKGQTGLSVAFDLPTQMGLDSNDPRARGEVGRTGVAISSVEDMERLFRDIPLDRVSVSMTINATASILLCMFLYLAEKRGISWNSLQGTIQNDILKEYIARGTYIFPPVPSLSLVVDVIEFCLRYVPAWHPISISGYHIREAGATAVQEMAFTLGNGIAYVENAKERGLKIDAFAPRLSFFFASHNHLLEEVAKFRALRRMWARLMKERFGASDPESMKMRFHVQTAGSTLTFQQPLNNIVRVTLQALAAVLGGAQSLHTNAYDEAIALPTEASATIALRTQQILAYETGIGDTVDPLGGSYFVESLTRALEEKAQEYLLKIQERGGMLEAIQSGFIQQEIANSAYERQQKIEQNSEILVGVNAFQEKKRVKIPRLKIRPEVEEKQIQRLKAFTLKRDSRTLSQALRSLRKYAREKKNLLPAIYEAVKAHATVGEISSVLREVYGSYHPELFTPSL